MGRFSAIHRKHFVGAAPSSSLILGQNVNGTRYDHLASGGTLNLAYGGSLEYTDGTGNHQLPWENYDANFQPASLPAGATSLNYFMTISKDLSPQDMAWDGGSHVTAVTATVGTIGGFTPGTNSAVYTPGADQPDPTVQKIVFHVSDVTDPPRNLRVTKQGVVGPYDPVWIADRQADTSPGGFIRWMKAQGVEANGGTNQAWAGGTQAAPNYPMKGPQPLGSALWAAYDVQVNGFAGDGIPAEHMAAASWAANQNNVWAVSHYNWSDAQLQEFVHLVLASLAPGQIFALEVPNNEPWNNSYGNQWAQAGAEGAELGIGGANERLAQKAIHFAQLARAQAAADGKSSQLVIGYGMLVVSPDTAQTFLDMAPGGGPALKTVLDFIAVAPYAGFSAINVTLNPQTATVAAGIADLDTGSKTMIDYTAQYVEIAANNGLGLKTYEAGDGIQGVADLAWQASLQADAGMRGHRIRYLQYAELTLPVGTDFVMFVANDLNDQFGAFGNKYYEGSALTPQGEGTVAFLQGERQLLPSPTATIGSVALPAVNGQSLGFMERTVKGSTWALNNNDGGRIAIDPTTGELTVANASLFNAEETDRTLDIWEIHPGDPLGHISNVRTYDVKQAYRYARLLVTNTPNGQGPFDGVLVSEFILASSVGGPSQLFGGVASGGTTVYDPPNPPSHAIDNDPATWAGGGGDGSTTGLVAAPFTIIVDMGSQILTPVEARITCHTTPFAPSDFTIDVSNDEATWTNIVSETGVVWSANGQTQAWPTT